MPDRGTPRGGGGGGVRGFRGAPPPPPPHPPTHTDAPPAGGGLLSGTSGEQPPKPSLIRGDVGVTRGGVVFPANSDIRVFPGDSIRTGEGEAIRLVSEDSEMQFGENTLAKI